MPASISVSGDREDHLSVKYFGVVWLLGFRVLLIVPFRAPFDLFDSKQKRCYLKLYVLAAVSSRTGVTCSFPSVPCFFRVEGQLVSACCCSCQVAHRSTCASSSCTSLVFIIEGCDVRTPEWLYFVVASSQRIFLCTFLVRLCCCTRPRAST